jgi:hypothetical protein
LPFWVENVLYLAVKLQATGQNLHDGGKRDYGLGTAMESRSVSLRRKSLSSCKPKNDVPKPENEQSKSLGFVGTARDADEISIWFRDRHMLSGVNLFGE